MPGLRVLVVVLLLLACQDGQNLLSAEDADYDGDGTRNAEDCAPYDPHVEGDADGDLWWDERCLLYAEAGREGYFVTGDPARYADCDDQSPDVNPDHPEAAGQGIVEEGDACGAEGTVPAVAT